MNKLQLDFVCAYADVYDLMNDPFSKVLDIIEHDIMSSLDWGEDSYMVSPEMFVEEFMRCYNTMKKYGHLDKVKSFMKGGWSFFGSCYQFDIL